MNALLLMCFGGAGAAIAASFFYYRMPSRRLVIAVNCGACALIAALTAYPNAHPVLTPLLAGFLSTSAPLTSVFLPWPAIETVSEAIQFTGRICGLLALNLLYGTVFAIVGFLSIFFFTAPPLP